ncbi:MAG: putative DNA binding domain-containing protein [Lactobacillales bacterium]|jgi:ATP-dependent DNA helicase RecG|nr:putative DNA binding domain-containing protein [Lactobacillales bacterium]
MFNKKESEVVELKLKKTDNFYKTVSAFANYGGGEIIFGVKDDGEVVGINGGVDKFELSIANSINDKVSPIPPFSIRSEIYENKTIVILNVFKGDKQPYYFGHHVYQRQGTTTVAVDTFEMNRLVLHSARFTYDEKPVAERDFKFNLLEKYLQKETGIEKLTNEGLRTLGLLVKNEYNVTAELLADISSRKFGIDIVKFGDNDDIFLDRKTLVGISILEQYEQAKEMFNKWYAPYEVVNANTREQRIHIPEIAFKEVLANAIAHRNWDINSNVRISMFSDRLEIVSPGGLPDGISAEEYKAGSVSDIRNNLLASVLHRIKIIETFATGIRRVKEQYREFLELPEFEVSENYIKVTLPVISYDDDIAADRLIINELSKRSLKRSDIAKILELHDAKVKRELANLVERGKVKRVGSGPSTYYELID